MLSFGLEPEIPLDARKVEELLSLQVGRESSGHAREAY
jgi:hypothetical protein